MEWHKYFQPNLDRGSSLTLLHLFFCRIFWLWSSVSLAHSSLLSCLWLLQDSRESLPWWMKAWKGVWFKVVLGFYLSWGALESGLVIERPPQIPLPSFDRHIHCLSSNISGFCTRLINRYLFCASQQSLLNPVTPLWVCVFVDACVCMCLFMDELLFICKRKIFVRFFEPTGTKCYWLLGTY